MPAVSKIAAEDIIGDYRTFFGDVLARTRRAVGLMDAVPVSHVAYRTATLAEYRETRDLLRSISVADVENVWNGRPIDKLLLKQPLELAPGFCTTLIELIPPPHRQDYPMGLEHAGLVLGDTFDTFVETHRRVLTGQQDQGPYCQPAYVTFDNGRTMKFYRYSLRDVVEMEGRRFLPEAAGGSGP